MTDGIKLTITGPPVTEELQKLFGWYRRGFAVKGIVTTREGLSVVYEDGICVLFAPVAAIDGPDERTIN